jgi:GH35 family endo-1,4-beta-xylanase
MEKTWTENEIKEIIIYAKQWKQEVEDANAKLIMMNAALEREEKKVTRLTNMIKYLTNGGEIHNT